MKHGIVPPTINHTVVDENIDPSLNLTLNKPQKREIKVAMSNTFGFGGHNACVLIQKIRRIIHARILKKIFEKIPVF